MYSLARLAAIYRTPSDLLPDNRSLDASDPDGFDPDPTLNKKKPDLTLKKLNS